MPKDKGKKTGGRVYDADSIQSIKDDRNRVRKRPSTYIPNTHKEGVLHTDEEIFDNALDEANVDGSVCDHITFMYDSKTRERSVIDRGAGIPHQKMLDALTVLNTSGKFDNNKDTAYQKSGGTNGVGLKLATFLSDYLKAISTRDGKLLQFNFEDGLLVDKIEGKAKGHGTVITYRLSKRFLDVQDVNGSDIKKLIKEKSYVFPHLKLQYIELEDGMEKINKTYTGKDISDRLKEFKPDTDHIRITKIAVPYQIISDDLTKTIDMDIDIDFAFAFSEKAIEENEFIKNNISYANTIRTTLGGAHIEGLKEGIIKFVKAEFPKYLNKRESEVYQLTNTDITNGLVSVIWIGITNPKFRGQYKDMITNPEIKGVIRDAVYNALVEEAKEGKVKKMMEFIKEVVRGRLASKASKKKKDTDNSFSKDKVNKFHPIMKTTKTKRRVLYIVEGDSALTAALNARDIYNDALYAMTGRPKNLIDMNASMAEKVKCAFMEICDILGVQIGKNFNPEDLKYDEIKLLSDADTDGDAMAMSIVGLMAKFTPWLIKHGYVYRVHPPLYRFNHKGKDKYIMSQKALYEHVSSEFSKNATISIKGKEMNPKMMAKFIEINFNYLTELNNFADRYYIKRPLAERLAVFFNPASPDNKKVSYWKKVIKDYPEFEVVEVDGNVIIRGTHDGKGVVVILDQHFAKNVRKFKAIMDRNFWIYGYSVNKKDDLSLYGVMKELNRYMPSDIYRFKGLGEINSEQLAKLCFDRDNQYATRFTFKNVPKDMEMVYVMLSGKSAYRTARMNLLMNATADDIELDT